MIPYLVAKGGSLAGSIFILGRRTLLGRCGDSDVQLMEAECSRRHALIIKEDDETYRLGDLSSTNGSYVGKQRVGEHLLSNGDILHFGRSTLVFRLAADVQALVKAVKEEDLKLLSGPADEGTRGIPLERMARVWWERMVVVHGEDGRTVIEEGDGGPTRRMLVPAAEQTGTDCNLDILPEVATKGS